MIVENIYPEHTDMAEWEYFGTSLISILENLLLQEEPDKITSEECICCSDEKEDCK